MPRPLRLEFEGAYYHVMSRGDGTATATATATPASQVSIPAFNPDGGTWFITQQRSVTVTTSTTGANMRYTINGAPPTSTTGTPISGPVNVTPSPMGTTLRVIAYKAGMIDSPGARSRFFLRERQWREH